MSGCITRGEGGGQATLFFFLARLLAVRMGFIFFYVLNSEAWEAACAKVLRCTSGEGAGFLRETELQSFIFLLFGFTLLLHQGQWGTKNPLRG